VLWRKFRCSGDAVWPGTDGLLRSTFVRCDVCVAEKATSRIYYEQSVHSNAQDQVPREVNVRKDLVPCSCSQLRRWKHFPVVLEHCPGLPGTQKYFWTGTKYNGPYAQKPLIVSRAYLWYFQTMRALQSRNASTFSWFRRIRFFSSGSSLRKTLRRFW
jgi:hypothetical protein